MPDSMHGVIALEHFHRYLFARQFVRGRDVLDIASGQGYGSALLAQVARSVVGVDIDEASVKDAQSHYGSDRLQFVAGDCACIPLGDATVDVVVSFETLEHHARHEEMLREIRRVLRPEGLLVLSTPDRLLYSEAEGFHNPFHVKELDEAEFRSLMQRHFPNLQLLRQRVLAGSWLLADVPGSTQSLDLFGPDVSSEVRNGLADAPYMIAVASGADLPDIRGGALEQNLGVLAAGMVRDQILQTIALVKTLAVPGSSALRARLNDPWYLAQNPDLVSPDLDRYAHWIENGAAEGRMPAPDLDQLVQDLAEERIEAADTRQLQALESRLLEQHRQLTEGIFSQTQPLVRLPQQLDALGHAWRDDVARLGRELTEADRARHADIQAQEAMVLSANARFDELLHLTRDDLLAALRSASTEADTRSAAQADSLQLIGAQIELESRQRQAQATEALEAWRTAHEFQVQHAGAIEAALESASRERAARAGDIRSGIAALKNQLGLMEAAFSAGREVEQQWIAQIARLNALNADLIVRDRANVEQLDRRTAELKEVHDAAALERRASRAELASTQERHEAHVRECAAENARALETSQITFSESLRELTDAWEHQRAEAAELVQALRGDLLAAQTISTDTLRQLADAQNRANAQREAWEQERLGMVATLHGIRSTRSWRWTAPLRRLVRLWSPQSNAAGELDQREPP